MLSNTASPTILGGGRKVNVIPGRASVDLDGRVLPGQTEASFLRELRDALGPDARGARVDVLESRPPTETSPNTPLFAHLARTLRKHDPLGIPLPYMIPGFTDATAYAQPRDQVLRLRSRALRARRGRQFLARCTTATTSASRSKGSAGGSACCTRRCAGSSCGREPRGVTKPTNLAHCTPVLPAFRDATLLKRGSVG